MKHLLVTLMMVVVLGGCDNDLGSQSLDGSTGGTGGTTLFTCESLTAPPEGCGSSCTGDFQCNAGLFCTNGSCIASCSASDPCPDGEQCNSRGRCIDIPNDGGTGGTDGQSCIDDEITPTRIVPNVMFLVDRSGSMLWEVANNSSPEPGELDRWETAHGAVTLVLGELDSVVTFGLTTYHWNDDEYTGDPGDPECPILHTVEFGGDIAGSYSSTFPNDPQGGSNDTPTGDSIDSLVAAIQADPPPATGPTILVLVTDGDPDSCEDPDPQDEQAEAVAATRNAFLAGFETFMLSIGPHVSGGHMQDMACEGVGIDNTSPSCTMENAPFWIGNNVNELADQFRGIITDQISCEVQMNGTVEDFDRVCEGDVELNGTPLTCQHGQSCTAGPTSNCNGWRIKAGTDDVLELLGQACQDFKEGAEPLTAVFPCGIIIVE